MLLQAIGVTIFALSATTAAVNDSQGLSGTLSTYMPQTDVRTTRQTAITRGFMSLYKYFKSYLGGSFTPPAPQAGGGGGGFSYTSGPAPGGVAYGGDAIVTTTPTVIQYQNPNLGDGSYNWSFIKVNPLISASEQGKVDLNVPEGPGTVAKGSYRYQAPDNNYFFVNYTADENGFRATGRHLPTPPPIPDAIVKALIQNAIDEELGIFDDGSYKGDGYNAKSATGPVALSIPIPLRNLLKRSPAKVTVIEY